MQLTLSAQEEELLRTILGEHHRELLLEIAKSDTRDFREDLKHKATLLESLLAQLGTQQSSAA
jgi:hypothetical protein